MSDSKLSSTNLVNSYITDFNERFQKCRYMKNLNIDTNLTRSLALMNSVQDVDVFNSNSIPGTQFFINLYKLLSISELDEDLMWNCISILQHTSKNLNTRKAIVTKFGFFPLLSNILSKLNVKEKTDKLLELMQNLSYGIVITWEEPYLADLIATLLKLIESEEMDLAQLSILILINICHRNPIVICLLMRTVNVSEFCTKLKKFGVLANKLSLILNSDSSMNQNDIECLMKKCFIDMESALEIENLPLIQHIIYFFEELKDNEKFTEAVVKFPNLEEEFEKMLKVIQCSLKKHSPKEDVNKDDSIEIDNSEIFVSITLEFLSQTVQIMSVLKNKCPDVVSKEIIVSIIEICQPWCTNKSAGENAVKLFKSLVEFVNDDMLPTVIENFKILPDLITIIENNTHSSEYAIAVQKLLLVLLKREKTENILFSLITDSYFDKTLQPLLSTKREFSNFISCSNSDLAKYLYCFIILIEFAKIAESTWKNKVIHYFSFHQMQFILAKGLISDNSEISELIFDISRIESFPKKEVSKFLVQLKCPSIERSKGVPLEASRNYETFFQQNQLIVSKDYEHRLNAILNKFNSKQEYESVSTSEIIELYMHKTHMTESKIHNLQKNLEDANQRILDLTHENNLQSAELSKYTYINLQMNLKSEWLVNENKDLKKQRDIFKNTANDLGKTVKEKSETLKRHMKAHEVKYSEKVNELNSLRKELNQVEKQRDDHIQKIQELTVESEDYVNKIESLKKSLQILEQKCVENNANIEQKEKEIQKLNKTIEDMKKSHAMQESIIKNLEAQLKDKNETIRQLEAEINEVEDMRKTIMSLMESKKPKRKT